MDLIITEKRINKVIALVESFELFIVASTNPATSVRDNTQMFNLTELAIEELELISSEVLAISGNRKAPNEEAFEAKY